MAKALKIGDVITAYFPTHNPAGHEQQGLRPAIVIGLPDNVAKPRFPMLLVAPITTDHGQRWASSDLYIHLSRKFTGLTADSIVMLDQIRSLDVGRIHHYIKSLSEPQYQQIKRVIASMTNLKL